VLVISSESIRYLRKKQEGNGAVYQVFMGFQESLWFGKEGALSIVQSVTMVYTRKECCLGRSLEIKSIANSESKHLSHV